MLFAWAVLFFIVFPIWAIRAIRGTKREADEIFDRLGQLETTLAKLQRPPVVAEPQVIIPQPVVVKPPVPPPLPVTPKVEETAEPQPIFESQAYETQAPPLESVSAFPQINWERFMGVNLFAWIGGFALFLGVAFFVKYSIDNNLISPQLRVAIGFLLGAGLLVTGVRFSAKEYKVTSHTLCATAIVILYADIFAAHAFYGFISNATSFLLMILTTATAFLLAVRLDARVVAILGLLGGFLTPPLLSTGVDRPLGLFGYIAFLDAGLVLVALKKRWSFLTVLAAAGTVLMQIGWVVKFFMVSKVFTAMWIFFTFDALFLATFIASIQTRRYSNAYTASAILMPFVTLCFLSYLLAMRSLGSRPGILFTFAFFSDLCLMVLALRRPSLSVVHRIGGIFVFIILSSWTVRYISTDLLYWGLGSYFVFAFLHTAFPLVLQRLHSETAPKWWDHLFAPLALILAMIPVFKLTEMSTGFWFAVMLINFVAIGFALITAGMLSIVAALLISMATILVWLFQMPASVVDLPEFLIVTAVFAVVFFVVGLYFRKKFAFELPSSRVSQAQIPALAAILPFLLLILSVLRLPLQSPTPVFALGLVLVILLIGLCRMLRMDNLSTVAMLCAVALQYMWQNVRFQPAFALVPLCWYLLFSGIFIVFPYMLQRDQQQRILPWATAALAGPLHFYLIYRLVFAAFPNSYMGVLPLLFSIPAFLGLIQRLRVLPEDSASRNSQLAWFGGVALFFVTLIFPVQFEREWVLIGWALEGAALLWLFHRIPHPGLKLVGASLLAVAFLGLINPDFFLIHPRSSYRIFNWYLYTYGIVIVALMIGGRLMNSPGNKIGPINVQPILYAMGTLLAFLLMNIEIADYYIAFDSSGSFARDMTYSIAWALFAFGLLIAGIRKGIRAARYGSLLLLGITLLKLFFHDLANLNQLYRVGALVGVAVVLILASYLYQRYVSFEPPGAEKL